MKKTIAIIDLGTNTFHLLIAEKDGDKVTLLHREKQAVKLGLAGINQGWITDEAIQRGLSSLRNFKGTMDKFKVEEVKAIGTSALRSARNGSEVALQFQKETGIDVTLISGAQEAEYIYYGIRQALELGAQKSLILDIGGGSVEFIIGNGNEIFWKRSYEMGAQRLLELFHRHDPMQEADIRDLDAYFRSSLTSLQEAIEKFQPVDLVGSSGTFDTLSDIYCIRKGIRLLPDQAETPLTIEAFHEIQKEFLSKNRAQRMMIPGMIEMRVDMIVVAGCLIKYMLNAFPFRGIRVSSYSLKEGVLARWDS